MDNKYLVCCSLQLGGGLRVCRAHIKVFSKSIVRKIIFNTTNSCIIALCVPVTFVKKATNERL